MWEEFKIKNFILKNRIVRSATNEHLGTLDGMITDEYIRTYEKLAKSGIGMIITSHMAVNKDQRADLTHICINEKENYDRLCELTRKVHNNNSFIIAQLSYGGRPASKLIGKKAMTPSETDETSFMSYNDLKKCVSDYVNAIKVAKSAGFDGIQLHLAHRYLLCEFLDPYYNKRDDEYGGNVVNRYRIVHEILEGVKEIVSDSNFLVLAKLNSTSFGSEDFIMQQIDVCRMLKDDGVDCIEVSGCDYKNYKQTLPYYLQQALEIKNSVNIPIMLVGGFRNCENINFALEKGIDLVSMARPFINDDNFVSKLKNNESSKCINCNRCFTIYNTLYKRCVFHKDVNLQLYDNYKDACK